MTTNLKKTVQAKPDGSRRKFLTGAAAATTGAAIAGFPMISIAQTPITLRWQSTWPAKDIFHEYALDYAKKVNDMAGGDLKIEGLPAGALGAAVGLLDAGSQGTPDGGHRGGGDWDGETPAMALWGSGAAWGMDANMLLAWHNYGGGKDLLNEIYTGLNLDVVSFLYGPMPTQPLGWYKKPITKTADFKGLKFRTVGLSIDIFTGMGAAVNALPGGEIVAAMDRGLLDAAEFNNTSSDKALGFPDVSKVCMLKSWHQSSEEFEIIFNKTKYATLPDKLKAIIANAVEASSADMSWKAIDRYSKDYIELQKMGVKFYATPQAILQDQLKIWDEVVAKKEAENPMFKKVNASMRAYAERATKWQYDTNNDYRAAVNHYFGQKTAGAAPKKT